LYPYTFVAGVFLRGWYPVAVVVRARLAASGGTTYGYGPITGNRMQKKMQGFDVTRDADSLAVAGREKSNCHSS
jgi:hypothetical protein